MDAEATLNRLSVIVLRRANDLLRLAAVFFRVCKPFDNFFTEICIYMKSDIEQLTEALISFRNEREWEQFHTTKNLATAIAVEAAELNELFLWKTPQEAEEVNRQRLSEELADVMAYCLMLADRHQLDVKQIMLDKIKLNGEKYPVEKSKGSAKKYSEL
jgi:NTP pyrophosphatase (non-canonical NTP hydrolase)